MQSLTSDLLGTNLFSFTKLTDSGANFTSFGDSDINNRGLVAFSAAKASSSQISGIYTSNGSQTTAVIEQSGLADLFRSNIGNVGGIPSNATSVQYSFGNDVEINIQGNVLFEAKADFVIPGTSINKINGLFLKKGNSITSVAGIESISSAGNPIVASFTGFGLNDRDQIVYATDTTLYTPRAFGGTAIVFEGRTIASGSTGPYGPQSRVFNPVVTNNGSVYYARSGDAYGDLTDVQANNVYRLSSGETTPVALSPERLTITGLSANNAGTVVFSGSIASGESGVFQLNSSGIRKISDTGINPFINDFGIVAYQPVQDSTPAGISVTVPQLNNLTRSIISPGDVLFGSTVSSVELDGINRSGQIAFVATFSDGTSGLFRADPQLRINLNQALTYAGEELVAAIT